MLKITRCQANPIISQLELPWAKHQVFNPGVIFDGQLFRMLFTASPGDGSLCLGYAESTDGVHFDIAPEPFMTPSNDASQFDYGTVDDPRITFLEGRYWIVYAARSQNTLDYANGKYRTGPNGERFVTWRNNYRRLGLAVTDDWKTVTRLGPLSSMHLCDANGLLFPEKIDGKYIYLHRPTSATAWTLPMRYNPGAIWILFTDKIDFWSTDRREDPWNMIDKVDMPDDYLLIRPEQSWESDKVGALGVPIPTDDGFLMFYHGVERAGTYRVGMLLLDRKNPCRVLCRTPEPVMEPEGKLETTGIYPGCIFPCANVTVNDEIMLYYGAGDKNIMMASMGLKDALSHVKLFPVH